MKEKLNFAIDRYNGFLKYTFPKNKTTQQWIQAIGKNEYSINDFCFEHVYRCYHHSFKVIHMYTSVQQLIDITILLFNDISKEKFEVLKSHKEYVGFPPLIKKLYSEKITYQEAAQIIYKKNSMSLGFVTDILSRKPTNKSGWADYTKHHLTYMGGVYWSILTTVSLLGILMSDLRGTKAKEYYITYPRGIKDYYISDLKDPLKIQKGLQLLSQH